MFRPLVASWLSWEATDGELQLLGAVLDLLLIGLKFGF